MEKENILNKEKSHIIALLGCNNCGVHEPSCNNCGKEFTRRNQIIYCKEIEHFGDNKHYCSRCNSKN